VIRRSWRTHLKASTTPEAVLTSVSQYLEEWSAAEVASLPSGAWPAPLRTRADLVAHAVKLGKLHSEFAGEPRSLAALQELLLFFTHAAVRITQLTPLPEAEPQRDAQNPGPAMRKPVAGEES
jgi:hypothetical protein